MTLYPLLTHSDTLHPCSNPDPTSLCLSGYLYIILSWRNQDPLTKPLALPLPLSFFLKVSSTIAGLVQLSQTKVCVCYSMHLCVLLALSQTLYRVTEWHSDMGHRRESERMWGEKGTSASEWRGTGLVGKGKKVQKCKAWNTVESLTVWGEEYLLFWSKPYDKGAI